MQELGGMPGIRVPNSSWNCLSRGMGKMRNYCFYSSGNGVMGNKLFSFPSGMRNKTLSSRFPKISNHLNIRGFFEPIFYAIQMWETIHFSNIVVFIISVLIFSQKYDNLLCWSWKYNSWDMIACMFDNKFKNVLLPTQVCSIQCLCYSDLGS